MTATSDETATGPVHRLQGPERVAALLLAMGRPVAERLLPYFEPDEIEIVSDAAAALGTVPPAEIELLIEEFANAFGAGLNLLLSAREMKELLTGATPPDRPDRAAQEAAEAADNAIWSRVADLPDEMLAGYLAGEHPQTVALILSRLRPDKASAMIVLLPAAHRDETVRRMLTSKPATDAALAAVTAALRDDLLTNPAKSAGPDPHERLAKIINNLEHDAIEGVMQSLGNTRPHSAELVKGMLFSFEDIVFLAPQARSTLFDGVADEALVLALKGADDDVREAALSALPSRGRRVVESELDRKEPAAQRDVAAARREIVNRALDLAGRGEIALQAPTEGQPDLMIA